MPPKSLPAITSLPAFSYGTQRYGVTHDRKQRLRPGYGRVQEFYIGQESIIEDVFLLAVAAAATCVACADGGEEHGTELLACGREESVNFRFSLCV